MTKRSARRWSYAIVSSTVRTHDTVEPSHGWGPRLGFAGVGGPALLYRYDFPAALRRCVLAGRCIPSFRMPLTVRTRDALGIYAASLDSVITSLSSYRSLFEPIFRDRPINSPDFGCHRSCYQQVFTTGPSQSGAFTAAGRNRATSPGSTSALLVSHSSHIDVMRLQRSTATPGRRRATFAPRIETRLATRGSLGRTCGLHGADFHPGVKSGARPQP